MEEEKILTDDEKFAHFMKGDIDLKLTPEEIDEIFTEERIREIFDEIPVVFSDTVPPEDKILIGFPCKLPNYEVYPCGTEDDFYFTAVKKQLIITDGDIENVHQLETEQDETNS